MSRIKKLTSEDIIEQELNPERLICPCCGKRVVVPSSLAGNKYGVCSVCYERAKYAAKIYEAEYISAQRNYNRQRKANERTLKDTQRRTGLILDTPKTDIEDFIDT